MTEQTESFLDHLRYIRDLYRGARATAREAAEVLRFAEDKLQNPPGPQDFPKVRGELILLMNEDISGGRGATLRVPEVFWYYDPARGRYIKLRRREVLLQAAVWPVQHTIYAEAMSSADYDLSPTRCILEGDPGLAFKEEDRDLEGMRILWAKADIDDHRLRIRRAREEIEGHQRAIEDLEAKIDSGHFKDNAYFPPWAC